MQSINAEEALVVLAEWAKAQVHREKTGRTYAKQFYQGIGHDKSVMEKITDELNGAPEGKRRALKQLVPYGDRGGMAAIIEEYEEM